MEQLLITTQDNFGDFQIERTLGIVKGNTVRTRNLARNFIAGLRTIVGGEVPEYTKAAAEAREQAQDRMIEHAIQLGADAIVGVRFITTEVGQTCAEILAYGTAVKLRNP